MKTMIKTSLIALALLVSAGASAQTPISFGVKAGANLANFGGKDVSGTDAKIGFNVGLTADINVAPSLYVLTGLELTTKGAKADGAVDEDGEKADVTFNPMYLQLPIHLGYKLEVAPGTNIVFRAGPYLAYGVGGKFKAKSEGVEGSIDFFGDGENQFGGKRFDFGLGGGVGAEFGPIGVTLGYDFGMAKVLKDAKTYNRNAYLSVGYRF